MRTTRVSALLSRVGPKLSLVGPILALVGPMMLVGPVVRAQGPTLDDVLGLASDYVVAYQKELSGVVSEESYLQVFERRPGTVAQRRELKADVLLVRVPGAARYVQFRDVFEVDGRMVRDRQDRLTRLFLDPTQNATSQMNRIIEESARYNIGNIERTMNVPTLPLLFLDPAFMLRFEFDRSENRVPETMNGTVRGNDGSAARFTASTEVWVISYQEIGRNTLIRTSGGMDLPARGRFWVEPASGRVVMTELSVGDANVYGLVDVSYALEPSANMVVPVAMRERYRNPRSGAQIEGSAVYSRFRRFSVSATDDVATEPAGPQTPGR
jgi:hypothetical protein